MMRYFRFQLHQLLTNRKNLAVIGIALVALICQFVFFRQIRCHLNFRQVRC